MDNITFQQIEAFISIAETLNLSKSAKVLFISQPSLSRMITRLETALDTKLFNRSNRGVSLNAEGEYLYNELLPVYHKMRLAFHNVQNIHKVPNKVLRIGCHTASDMMCAFDKIRDGITAFQESNPEIEIVENVYEFKELRQALIFSEVDVIFSVSIALEDLNNVSRKRICEIGLFAAMSNTHPLAAEEKLDMEKLNDEVFFFPSSRDTQTRSNNELEQCMQIGFMPKSIQYLPNLSSVLKAVREGKGMTMCGKYKDVPGACNMKFFPLEIPAHANQPFVEAAWRTNDISEEALELVRIIENMN